MSARLTSRNGKRIFLIALCLIILILLGTSCGKTDLKTNIDGQIEKTAAYLREQVKEPKVSSIGGEWLIIGLANSGVKTDEEYFNNYLINVKAASLKNDFFDENRYNTDYARIILALSSLDKKASDIISKDLTAYLDDYNKITNQGINAASYALIAANVSGINLSNEERYIDYIKKELNEEMGSDYFSMAITGLSFYKDRADVKENIDSYVNMLSKLQNNDGGMGNCISTTETIIALSQIGIDVNKDSRFIKNDKGLLDYISSCGLKDGSFAKTPDEENADQMTTEKVLIALDSVKSAKEGEALYEREN